jgi:hypothetical protein
MLESFYSGVLKRITLKFSTSCQRVDVRAGPWDLFFWDFYEWESLLFGEKNLILVFG